MALDAVRLIEMEALPEQQLLVYQRDQVYLLNENLLL